jgi:hypothetical protein
MGRELLEYIRGATGMKARSSALHTLVVALVWAMAALLLSATCHAPEVVVNVLVYLVGGLGLMMLLGFAYFAIRSPDNLRSEQFVLRKEEIARTGDSSMGLRETELRTLPEPACDPKLLRGNES